MERWRGRSISSPGDDAARTGAVMGGPLIRAAVRMYVQIWGNPFMMSALTTVWPSSIFVVCLVNLLDLSLGPMVIFRSLLLSELADCNPLPPGSPRGRWHGCRQWATSTCQITRQSVLSQAAAYSTQGPIRLLSRQSPWRNPFVGSFSCKARDRHIRRVSESGERAAASDILVHAIRAKQAFRLPSSVRGGADAHWRRVRLVRCSCDSPVFFFAKTLNSSKRLTTRADGQNPLTPRVPFGELFCYQSIWSLDLSLGDVLIGIQV